MNTPTTPPSIGVTTVPPGANVTEENYSDAHGYLMKIDHVLNINSAALIILMFGFFTLLVIVVLAAYSCQKKKNANRNRDFLLLPEAPVTDYKATLNDKVLKDKVPISHSQKPQFP